MDTIHEGITLAVAGVRDIMRDDGVSRAEAIQVARDTFATWEWRPYGADADAVRDAAWSQLSDMAREQADMDRARKVVGR
jgi:hypothetical protein